MDIIAVFDEYNANLKKKLDEAITKGASSKGSYERGWYQGTANILEQLIADLDLTKREIQDGVITR